MIAGSRAGYTQSMSAQDLIEAAKGEVKAQPTQELGLPPHMKALLDTGYAHGLLLARVIASGVEPIEEAAQLHHEVAHLSAARAAAELAEGNKDARDDELARTVLRAGIALAQRDAMMRSLTSKAARGALSGQATGVATGATEQRSVTEGVTKEAAGAEAPAGQAQQ